MLPKAALLTVFFNTPPKYKNSIQKQTNQLGLDFYSIDTTSQNIGYAAALNKLVSENFTKYDVFFLANPDILLKGLNKHALLDAASHFDIWGYSMKQNAKTYYGGEIDKWRMSGGLITKKPASRFTPCQFVSGSLMAVKRSVFDRVGLLDESYFMYYEDVEFCYRALKKGLRVGIDSQQTYEHFETSDANPYKQRWLEKNRMKFLLSHGTIMQKAYEVVRFPKTMLEKLR